MGNIYGRLSRVDGVIVRYGSELEVVVVSDRRNGAAVSGRACASRSVWCAANGGEDGRRVPVPVGAWPDVGR